MKKQIKPVLQAVGGPRPVKEARAAATQSVLRACEILRCFALPESILPLQEVTRACRLSKPTTYRLLQTLVQGGMLEMETKNRYRLPRMGGRRRRYRFGYASQTEEFSFSRLVSESIRSSAYAAGVDLLALNNRYSAAMALRNAAVFVREKVDLVVEFQTNQSVASQLSAALQDAKIPTIAIEIPHPGAYFYGANNYRAGMLAGRALGHACLVQWGGQVDEVLLLDLPMAGPLPQSRLTGTVAGLREVLPKFPESGVHSLKCNGRFATSLDVMRRYLRRNRAQKVLVAGMNDPSSLGALRAFEEAGFAERCLVVSQNGCLEARLEMRRPQSRLVGSVGYFPERYGDAVIGLGIDVLEHRDPPRSVFVRHHMITRENADELYPHDTQVENSDADSLLFTKR